LKESLDDSIINNKIAFTTTLSAIYDSIGNHEKRAYYDNLSSKLFFDNINKEVDKSKLQGLYNNYNERKVEKIKKEAKAITIKNIVIISVCVSISVVLLFLYIKYKHRKHSNRLISEIDTYAKEVECKNCIINEKEQLVKDYQEINVKKDEIIRKQKKELDKIKHKSDILDKKTKLDIFYKSDICENILKRDGLDLIPLTENELQLLMTTANYNLDNLIARLFNEFPKLTTIDMQCICLVVLLNNNSKIAYMLGRNRKTIWDRINRIKNIMGLDIKGDLFLHIIENYI
jgi:DNA-binding CsgD family transcriptional regulator